MPLNSNRLLKLLILVGTCEVRGEQFEANLAKLHWVKHAITVANGLDALRLIFKVILK